MARFDRRELKRLMEQAEAFRVEVVADGMSFETPDPVAWARRALGFELDGWQQRIMRSEHPRLICVAARQSGKAGCLAHVHLRIRVVPSTLPSAASTSVAVRVAKA